MAGKKRILYTDPVTATSEALYNIRKVFSGGCLTQGLPSQVEGRPRFVPGDNNPQRGAFRYESCSRRDRGVALDFTLYAGSTFKRGRSYGVTMGASLIKEIRLGSILSSRVLEEWRR
jgi:hypothetical protein